MMMEFRRKTSRSATDRLEQPDKHLLPVVRRLIIPSEAHTVRGEVNSHPAIMSLAFH